MISTPRPITTSEPQEYTPCDSQFDRSHLTDSQYIEQLVFENKELKALLEKQNKLLHSLNEELKRAKASQQHNNTPNEDSHPANGSVDTSHKAPTSLPPQPHKLLPAMVTNATQLSPVTSPVSQKSPRSTRFDETPSSPTQRRRYQQELQTQPPTIYEDRSTSSSPSQIPMRSSRRRENTNNINIENNNASNTTGNNNNNNNNNNNSNNEFKRHSSGSISSGVNNNNTNDANILDSYTGKSSSESLLSPYEHNNASVEASVEKVPSKDHSNTTVDIEAIKDTTSDFADNDSSRIKEHSVPVSINSTSTVDATTTSTVNKIYSQDRGLSRSSSSVGSTYKSSRIKLPTSNVPKNREVEDNKQAELGSLKSPNMFITHPGTARYETPPGQAVPSFAPRSEVPDTPEAFNDSKIGMNVTPIPHPLVNDEKEGRSHISSPLQGSFTHNSPALAPPYEPERPSHTTPTISSHSVYSTADPQTPGSSFHVLQSPNTETEESNLFIKPEEFNTIFISVVSTITVNSAHQTSKKNDDPNITITINDRETNKEMWRIRKTYSQMMLFDNEIRPIVEYFGLPALPEKGLFLSTTPSKVEMRRSIVQNYFNTIFLMPHIPHMVVFRICKFLSLDFVNPLDDFKSGARKEGFLIRKYKGLGSNWKIRWCQVDGPFLEIYENPGGLILEQIKLRGAQIGKQSSDSVAEDKGYRHAFVIMEPQKSSKLQSSLPKHFFCAETDEERDDWVSALVEYNDPSQDDYEISPVQNFDHSYLDTPASSRYEGNHIDELESRKYLSGGQQHSVSSFDQLSTNTSFSNEEMSISKDTTPSSKKPKKRSIFPFSRGNTKGTILENSTDDLESTSTVVASGQPLLPQQQPGDVSMQHYLNQLSLDADVAKSIFGRNVEVAYELSNHEFMGRQIPSICYRCLDYLNKTGAIFEEGIFRLSGSASTIRQLKDQFNMQYDLDLLKCALKPDIHTVAGLFKSYLRELPNPILGLNAYSHLNGVILHNTSSMPPSSIAAIFRDYFNDPENVDKIHYDITYVIFKFLRQVISQHPINRMNLRNVCIVFVPTLNISLEVLSTFLVDFECIFENGKPISDANREVLDVNIPNF